MQGIETLIVVSIVMFVVLGAISVLAHIYNLNNIKAKTVGDGQHGTARWARKGEIEKTYRHIPFTPELWRKGKNLPKPDDQGIVVGCNSTATGTTALVDTGDVHALMLSALFSLGGKMKYDTTGMDVAYVQSLYPNESPEVIIKAMLFVRENGYPQKVGIIAWFDFILHIMRDIVRLHATK